MKRKVRVGCLSVIAYCVIMSLVMHFAIGEGVFGAVGSLSTMHGGNSDYRKWHGQVLDDVTAPVQLPLLVTLYAINALVGGGVAVVSRWCRGESKTGTL